jgi:WD40 repeat protein
LSIRGATLLATGGDDGVVRLWDPETGQQRRVLPDQGAPVRDMCAVDVQGRMLLVSVGDTAVRLWDPELNERPSGAGVRASEITALAGVWQGNRELVACGRGDGMVQLRNAANGDEMRVLTGHDGPVTALSALFALGEVMLASGSTDDTVGVWTLSVARHRPQRSRRPGWSNAVCAVFLHRQVFLACAGQRGTVRLWDPYSGKERRPRRFLRWSPRRRPQAHTSWVSALYPIHSRNGARVASAGHDGTVRIWNLDTDRQEIVFAEHRGRVRSVCALTLGGESLVASAGDDQIVRVWELSTGTQRFALQGHTNRITAVCTVRANGRTLLASASHDGTARLWNPVTGACELTIPVHHEATACISAGDRLVIGLTAGTLAVRLNL